MVLTCSCNLLGTRLDKPARSEKETMHGSLKDPRPQALLDTIWLPHNAQRTKHITITADFQVVAHISPSLSFSRRCSSSISNSPQTRYRSFAFLSSRFASDCAEGRLDSILAASGIHTPLGAMQAHA